MSAAFPHPYESLSAATLRTATIGMLSAWGGLTLVLIWAVPFGHIASLHNLMDAGSPSVRRTILESWEPGVSISLSFLLGFDFLYDVVHNNAAALLAVWGGVRRGTRLARAAGGMTAWVLWLDSGLNVIENLSFLHILRSRSPESLLTVVSAIFSFRSATLVLGLSVGAALHISARRTGSRLVA